MLARTVASSPPADFWRCPITLLARDADSRLCCSLVARGNTILAEFTESNGAGAQLCCAV